MKSRGDNLEKGLKRWENRASDQNAPLSGIFEHLTIFYNRYTSLTAEKRALLHAELRLVIKPYREVRSHSFS